MLAEIADHVAVALFCAVLGVILGAATLGPFEVLVVVPSLVAACVVVLVAFALLARRQRRNTRVVSGDRGAESHHHSGQDLSE